MEEMNYNKNNSNNKTKQQIILIAYPPEHARLAMSRACDFSFREGEMRTATMTRRLPKSDAKYRK